MNNLVIAGATVRTDKNGRYSLNNLHKASGGEKRHGPSYWTATDQFLGMVAELETTVIPVVKIEGRNGGTFVCKELVYAYAMWISPSFSLRVIRAYDALVTGRVDEERRKVSRENARLEAACLTDAIRHRREVQGKEIAHYHFSNEFDLINRVALGQSAKQYREANGLGKEESIRDHLTPMEIRCIEHLQRANATLIDLGYDFEQRKANLHRIYVTRHAAALMAEVERISA